MRQNRKWITVACSKCGQSTPCNRDWISSSVTCPKCRFFASDIQSVIDEMTKINSIRYERELPGSTRKIASLVESVRWNGVGTTSGNLRLIAQHISQDQKLLSICLRVAKEFKDLEREQQAADKRNENRSINSALHTRRIS